MEFLIALQKTSVLFITWSAARTKSIGSCCSLRFKAVNAESAIAGAVFLPHGSRIMLSLNWFI